MRHLEMIKSQSIRGEAPMRDFLTLEDDLPATVVFGLTGARDRATSVTDVKHETTDDN